MRSGGGEVAGGVGICRGGASRWVKLFFRVWATRIQAWSLKYAGYVSTCYCCNVFFNCRNIFKDFRIFLFSCSDFWARSFTSILRWETSSLSVIMTTEMISIQAESIEVCPWATSGRNSMFVGLCPIWSIKLMMSSVLGIGCLVHAISVVMAF